MNKYLVTGGAGFIGSHIVEHLLKRGHFVRVLDNFSSGKRQNLKFAEQVKAKNYELIEGDIRDKKACERASQGIDFCLHQAALRSVPKSMLNPGEYNDVNITGTLNMLKASLRNRVKCFVFASSSSVYGETESFPEKESFLPMPISPYALTKLAGEHYCEIFARHYGLKTVSLRYFNVFGPRQSLDDEYAVVIPKFITSMLNDRRPPIYGNGRQSRDFTYVKNVVQANFLAARKEKLKGTVFNVASGRDYSILALAGILNKLLKKEIKPVFLKPRPGDVFRTLADLSRSKRILGFSPKIDFIQGLKFTIEYFIRHKV